MNNGAKLINGKELDAVLSELPEDIAQKVGEKSLREGAKIVLEEAQNLVPEGKTGKLADSLAIKKIKSTNTTMRVYARRGKGLGGWHANLVEFGTKPHTIRNVTINGKFYKKIEHPGTSPRPFMRPALIGKKAEALKEVQDSLRKYCFNAIKKSLKK